ncbi:MAG: aliphatic sulfonate ABC transporter substrate-binding protein [Crocosphaera sp.]|nr:aliphatic sulfonate ABC transporter substrate-binding protein [Crocosphaera sp.]
MLKNQRKWVKKWVNPLLSILALCLILTFSACSQNQSNQNNTNIPNGSEGSNVPTELRIGYQVVPNPEVLAKALGLVEEAFPDAKVEWRSFESGRDVNTAMVSNGIDIGENGFVPVATGIAQQLPYKVFFIQFLAGDNEGLAVKRDSNINNLSDLKGKKIAVTFGSTAHFSLLSALAQEGIEETDLTIIDMQPPEMLAAWQRGDIDGGFVWQPTLAKLVENDGKIVVTAKTLAEEQGIVSADLSVVHNDFVEQYPEAVQKYVSVLNEAVKYYRDNPEEAANKMSEELGLSPEETLKVMQEVVWLDASEQAKSDYLGTAETPGKLGAILKETGDFMVKQNIIQTAPDLETYQGAIYHNSVDQVAAQ